MFTFSGEATPVILNFASYLDGDQTSKAKTLFLLGQFFLLRDEPLWNAFVFQGSKQDVTEAIPLCKNGRKMPYLFG